MFNRNPPYSVEEKNEQLKRYEPFIDLFDDKIFVSLSEWDGKNFIGHVESTINNAINYLNSKIQNEKYCCISNAIIPQIVKYYKDFPEIFSLVLEGKRSQAFRKLTEEIMSKIGMAFTTFRQFTHRLDSDNESDYVFRMRYEKNVYQTNFKPLDLFHVPFEKRHLIGNNRFSLSGLPCLYFGSSIYCCWEEMNRPNLDYCFTSRFDLTGHHFIDLSRNSHDISNSLKMIYESLKASNEILPEDAVKIFEYLIDDYLRIWPLIFCSSIKTVHHEAVFKPEYIFPQLLLEWLISDDHNLYDGIKFNSTKEPLLEGRFELPIRDNMINYVIPARIVKNEGYCKESLQKIAVSEPINLLIEKLANNINGTGVGTHLYKESIFGQLESILENKELKKST
jgi:hypothetical protein